MPKGLRQFKARPAIIAALLLVFTVAGLFQFWGEPGEDLASSYVGCRIIATRQTGVLYSFSEDNFADVGDLTGTWERLGHAGGFRGYLHPYVQTPLWGFALQPLCDHTSFAAFAHWFLLAEMLSLAGVVWLVARHWAPRLFHPVAVGLVLLALWFSQPFGYAMFLLQTHALFFFLMVYGLVLAGKDDRWPAALGAGLCVAVAGAVKLTPLVLVVYWLLIGRWRAALTTVLWSAVLVGLTVLAVGPGLTHAYFDSLHRVSRVLLVAQNNQSFAAWAMQRFYRPDEVFDINILPLPPAVRYGSSLLMLLLTALGGWLDRRTAAATRNGPPPLGAALALVALTLFAPIAWTHYFILLVVPAMVLVQSVVRGRAWWLLVLLVPILALNYPPLATDVLHMDIGDYAVVRGQFFSGVLALVALAVAGLRSGEHGMARV